MNVEAQLAPAACSMPVPLSRLLLSTKSSLCLPCQRPFGPHTALQQPGCIICCLPCCMFAGFIAACTSHCLFHMLLLFLLHACLVAQCLSCSMSSCVHTALPAAGMNNLAAYFLSQICVPPAAYFAAIGHRSRQPFLSLRICPSVCRRHAAHHSWPSPVVCMLMALLRSGNHAYSGNTSSV